MSLEQDYEEEENKGKIANCIYWVNNSYATEIDRLSVRLLHTCGK